MDEIKIYYIRYINKIRRKMTSIISKINNNKKIGLDMYVNYAHKFQQLDNTLLLLEDEISDLGEIYNNTKIKLHQKENPVNLNSINISSNSANTSNGNKNSNHHNLMTKKELDILIPLFYYYYNIESHKTTNNETINLDEID
jgi:hypothetical protein